MGKYTEVIGDLITNAKLGYYDVIVHGCNCFNIQGAGLAPQMVKAFGTNNFLMEANIYKGDINKLGQIDYKVFIEQKQLVVVNAYTQYDLKPTYKAIALDYYALRLCMTKINHVFKGKQIGLPGFIGGGLAGGDPLLIRAIIKDTLQDCDTTVVFLEQNKGMMEK